MKQVFEAVITTAIFMMALSITLHYTFNLFSTTLTLNTLEYKSLEGWSTVLSIIYQNGLHSEKWDEWYIAQSNTNLANYMYVIYVEKFKLTPYPQTIWNITLGDSNNYERLSLTFYIILILDDGSMVKIICLS